VFVVYRRGSAENILECRHFCQKSFDEVKILTYQSSGGLTKLVFHH